MDNYRLILIFALGFLLMLLWQEWDNDYGRAAAPQQAQGQTAAGDGATNGESAGVPQVQTPTPQAGAAAAPDAPEALPQGRLVQVETDLYTLQIDTRGGAVTQVLLNHYPVSSDQPDTKFELMSPVRPDLFIAQSGLIASEGAEAPTHEAIYQAAQDRYVMEPGQDQMSVDLVWQSADGVQVTKRFLFSRDHYLVGVEHRVENASGEPWAGREYRQLIRTPDSGKNSESQFLYTYTGAVIYSPEKKYEKISFGDMEDGKLGREVTDGWIAMLQHYFLGAWVPQASQTNHFYSNVLSDQRYVIGAYTQPVTVPAGASHTFRTGFLAGPKIQSRLEEIAQGLDLTVDYGWLTILSKPIFWLLDHIHDLVGNWGWSIILLTILIKAAFFKLSATSYRSMANMRKLGPRLQALKDRYGDDKQKMNQAMMDMYKTEKINPLGGCLPILVQIPVFIALYWVLLESVELRQAPFILWIEDLSVKDPYFVLPLIMGVSMFIQQKLNPTPPDPMQAKIMMSLPFVFTIFFAFFPAGLVLYWVVNNILSISQQWYITRQIEQGASK